jgi:hypothetical protein
MVARWELQQAEQAKVGGLMGFLLYHVTSLQVGLCLLLVLVAHASVEGLLAQQAGEFMVALRTLQQPQQGMVGVFLGCLGTSDCSSVLMMHPGAGGRRCLGLFWQDQPRWCVASSSCHACCVVCCCAADNHRQ